MVSNCILISFLAPRSRKRRPSSSQDDNFKDTQMDECSAALVLMSLSCSPHSPNFNGKFYVIQLFISSHCVINEMKVVKNQIDLLRPSYLQTTCQALGEWQTRHLLRNRNRDNEIFENLGDSKSYQKIPFFCRYLLALDWCMQGKVHGHAIAYTFLQFKGHHVPHPHVSISLFTGFPWRLSTSPDSNISSSSASYRSTPSPPPRAYSPQSAPLSSSAGSDEGIVMDYQDEQPRKKKVISPMTIAPVLDSNGIRVMAAFDAIWSSFSPHAQFYHSHNQIILIKKAWSKWRIC